MRKNHRKICGIIGGVGPSATADLYKLIIKNTPAKKDQDHLRILIDSYPQIPDRTKAILNKGESPVPYLEESAKLLKQAGADFIACPCNTAHHFIPEVEKKTDIPFINMVKETARETKKKGFKKVGLLSTAGTASAGIYQKTFKKFNIEVIVPSPEGIKKEMKAIYGPKGIKSGVKYEKSQENKNLFKEVIVELKQKYVEGLIMGCTEIPLCLESKDTDLPLINPTEILAKAIVKKALI